MSRLKLDKINFEESDFLVEIKEKKEEKKEKEKKQHDEEKKQEKLEEIELEIKNKINEATLILNRAKDEAQALVDNAQKEAKDIIENAQKEANSTKDELIQNATNEANSIIQTAKETSEKENEELIQTSKDKIEQERIEITKKGYEDGYQDGLAHIQEELSEKIKIFDEFAQNQYILRDKLIKSANKDILDLIINISRKILLKELDFNALDKIIKSTISLLEKKENINIILSEKYARILYEHQKGSLSEEIEFNFEDFKQYDNFDIVYNPSFDDDTIIIENLKERYDASINSQLDVIIRNIYDNSQNGKLDLEQYEDETDWFKWNYK